MSLSPLSLSVSNFQSLYRDLLCSLCVSASEAVAGWAKINLCQSHPSVFLPFSAQRVASLFMRWSSHCKDSPPLTEWDETTPQSRYYSSFTEKHQWFRKLISPTRHPPPQPISVRWDLGVWVGLTRQMCHESVVAQDILWTAIKTEHFVCFYACLENKRKS